MTPPQQQANEMLARMIEECCIDPENKNCKKCSFEPKSGFRKGCCDFGYSDIALIIRSRPATTPECTIDDVVRMDHQIRYAQKQAAAKAREDVLDELKLWICEDRESLHRMQIIPALILHSLVIEKIQSLRTSTKETTP